MNFVHVKRESEGTDCRKYCMSREGRYVLAVSLILLALGITVLYSASAIFAAKRFGDEFYFLKRQVIWALLGVSGMLIVSRLDYRVWMRLRWVGLAVAVVLLLLVFVPKVGATINGARRWVRFGEFSLQPSEFARLALLVWVAAFIAKDPERMRSFTRGFLPCMLAVLLVVGLIAAERDVGGTACLLGSMIIVMVAGGARLVHLMPAGMAAAGGLVVLVLTKFHYVLNRIVTHYNPTPDALAGPMYQAHQSLVSLGSGGFFGEGLGQGIQKLFYLPEPHSDFILAILGEELGFLGTASVAFLFIILAVLGWRIAMRAQDPFGFLVAFGITFMIVAQAVVNIAVVTGSMPTKGIPLPLMSYGGSSLLFTCLAIGVLISIADRSQAVEPVVQTQDASACIGEANLVK